VQSGTGTPAAPCLHNLPDLAHDDAEQQQHRHSVHQQQRYDDIVGRRNRREIGEDNEGDERGE